MSYVEGSYWYYAPNKAAPIAFGVLYLISGVAHLIQSIHYKSWKVTGFLPVGALIFIAGFVMREIGAYHYDNQGIFIASTVLLLCAPPIWAAANYFILGRMLYYIPYHSPIHPGRVVSTFVGLDFLVEVLTGNGASKVANSSLSRTEIDVGSGLLKASLILQTLLLLGFIAVAARYTANCVRGGVFNRKLRVTMTVLLASSALLLVRSVYRIAEYFEVSELYDGKVGNLIRYEAFYWVFEAAPLLLNTVLLNLYHPCRYLPRSNKVFLARDGVSELEGPGWVDKRPFLLTLVDPFDLVGLCAGRDRKNVFWDEVEQAHGLHPRAEAGAV